MTLWDKIYHAKPALREEIILRALRQHDDFTHEAMQSLLRTGAVKPRVREPQE